MSLPPESKIALQRDGQCGQPVRASAGAAPEVLLRLHADDPFDGPLAAVLGLPPRVERQVGRKAHQRPGCLHPVIDVPLGLGHQIVDGIGLAGNLDGRGVWQADEGEVAEPLIFVPLPCLATRLERRFQAVVAGDQVPSAEAAPLLQVQECRRRLTLHVELQIGPKCQNAVYYLPGGICIRHEMPAHRDGQRVVDPIAESVPLGRRSRPGGRGTGAGKVAFAATQKRNYRDDGHKRDKQPRKRHMGKAWHGEELAAACARAAAVGCLHSPRGVGGPRPGS